MTTTSPASSLFSPVEIAGRTLRNRVVMAPMTRRFSPGGVPTGAVADYYVRRAEGGAGAIITEGLAIGHAGSVHDDAIPGFFRPESLDVWSKIAQRVHAAGAAFVPQFWHVGGYLGTLTGHSGNVAATSPSGLYAPGQPCGEPASQEDIDSVVAAYGDAAAAAFAMGCDGIDIHAGHGYLVDQFLWPETNKRDDGYGGDLVGRTRFACEVIAECRRRTASDFALFFRFSQWKIQDYTARLFAGPQELGTFLTLLVDAGVDVFDCSTRRFWTPEFDGSDLSLAAWTRQLSGKTTMAVGSVGLDSDVVASLHGGQEASGVSGLDVLDAMVQRGECDLVGVGRALLADADWTRKIELGDLSSLRGFTRRDLEFLT